MLAYITSDKIDIENIRQKLECIRCGSILEFSGVVRPEGMRDDFLGLYYDYHESMAPKILENIVNQAKEKFNLIDVVAVHRVGRVSVGDTSLYVAVSSSHRGESLKAMEWIVDEIKNRVPIWKKDLYKNGEIWHN